MRRRVLEARAESEAGRDEISASDTWTGDLGAQMFQQH